MFNKKKLITLTLPLSLLLAGCGDEGSSTPEPMLPTTNAGNTETEPADVTVTNPIPDMTAVIRSEFSYTINLSDFCTDSEGNSITASLSSSTGGIGLSIRLSGSTLTFVGTPTTAGLVNTTTLRCTSTSGQSITDSFTITTIDSNAPELSISFPLTTGIYSADSIYMFGNVEAISGYPLKTVTLTVDDMEYPTTVTGTTWRSDIEVPIADDSVIDIEAENTAGDTSHKEITLEKDDLYNAEIDNIVKDIAVDESTGEVYVQVSGTLASDTKIQQFNLDENESEELSTTPFFTSSFSYAAYIPTSLTFDTANERLVRSYQTGITYINLFSGYEFELSDTDNGTAGTGVVDFNFITDIFYDSTTDLIYVTDVNNSTVDVVDPDSGDRTSYITSVGEVMSVATDSTDGNIYYSQGYDASAAGLIKELANLTTITTIDSPTAGAISDLTLNEDDDEMFFINGDGDLIKLDLTDNSVTALKSTLFNVTTFATSATPSIGLHYDSVRNVLIAAGESTDGTNKLLVIDPVSGEYAQIATGQ